MNIPNGWGFNLEVINGVGNPKSNWLTQMDDGHFVREAAAAADKPSPEDEGKACELMFRQMTIDCVGSLLRPKTAMLRDAELSIAAHW